MITKATLEAWIESLGFSGSGIILQGMNKHRWWGFREVDELEG